MTIITNEIELVWLIQWLHGRIIKTCRHHAQRLRGFQGIRFSLTALLGIVVKLGGYPGRLLAVAADDVEVGEQVEGDLDEELEAKERQDAEVDVGQLGRKRLVVTRGGAAGQLLCGIGHFLGFCGGEGRTRRERQKKKRMEKIPCSCCRD